MRPERGRGGAAPPQDAVDGHKQGVDDRLVHQRFGDPRQGNYSVSQAQRDKWLAARTKTHTPNLYIGYSVVPSTTPALLYTEVARATSAKSVLTLSIWLTCRRAFRVREGVQIRPPF